MKKRIVRVFFFFCIFIIYLFIHSFLRKDVAQKGGESGEQLYPSEEAKASLGRVGRQW